MKTLVSLAIIGLGVISISCKSKKEVVQTETKSISSTSTTQSSSVRKSAVYPDSLLIRYERTACFGTCPVYVINVYNSGYATYEGKYHTKYMGMHYTMANLELIKGVIARANEVTFANYRDLYNDQAPSDLPWRILTIKTKQFTKTVEDRGGVAPEELKELQGYVERIFAETEWQAIK